ncbi:MAG: hypothetical protein AAGI90_07265, partial [Chlamydiota bacterium]
MNGTNTFTTSDGVTFTSGGTFTGGSSIVKEGPGTVSLTNPDTLYTGDVLVSDGTFEVVSGASMMDATFSVGPN